MKALVALEPGASPRLAAAAAGLALRGHEVSWVGPAPPSGIDGLRPIARRRDLWATNAEVVVGDGRRPLRATLRGWQARAFSQVLSLEHAAVQRWNTIDHLAWGSLHPLGLIEPSEAEAFRADPRGIALDRLGLWSDAPPSDAPDAAHPDSEILERACERARARHLGGAKRSAVFVDRDGTLVREVGYLSDPSELEILPGVPDALRALQAGGFVLVVISNQSGVGRGLFPLARVHEAMARLRRLLRAQGVELDAIYFCPHRPDAGCACRKPGIALLERAADDLQLSLRRSYLVGDKQLDVATAHRAMAAGILVRTGYGRDEEARGPEGERAPDTVCDDLPQAAAWILERETEVV